MKKNLFLATACMLGTIGFARAQQPPENYDESKIPPYTLPELLKAEDGTAITSADAWTATRRPELLALFEQHVFGRTPPAAAWGRMDFKVQEVKPDALDGRATRKLIHISLPDHPAWQGMDVLLYTPNGLDRAAPCFVGANFRGNHAVTSEMDIPISNSWMVADDGNDIVTRRASESRRWPLEKIISQGFAVATFYYGDIEPDRNDGWKRGLRAALSKDGADTGWKDGDWGAIGAWAWGLSRIADYLETDLNVDSKQLAVIGHSRLGKAALWAGAQDPRFRFVISNNSGEGGAAIMRRNIGETTAIITRSFPHWFTNTYRRYANNEAACPVDQHMLIALAAPRPIYIASASDDAWADPKGEFLSGLHAGPAYCLFGKIGLGITGQPATNSPTGDTIAYHLRKGSHDITTYDWEQYLKFVNRHFGN